MFYIDATNEQTLGADLISIAPEGVERSVNASLRWLASQPDSSWLIFYDNADDVDLNLRRFFPPCAFGNILVTTRNPQLRFHTGKDGDAKISEMDPNDAKKLLLLLARPEKIDGIDKLSKQIAKVFNLD